MGWVALDRAATLAEIRGDPEQAAAWRATADEIRADILAHGVSERGRAAPALRHRRAGRLDPAGGAVRLPAADRRTRCGRRCDAIADELTEDGFVLRYRTDETDDGMCGKEGTFLICSFWLVSALAVVGEMDRARELMERLLRVASPLGLYAEEFEAGTGRHLGNFPQAFSHLAMIEAAGRIILAERFGGADMTSLTNAYDVIIIGTGAGGGTLARQLAPSGKRILLLERGDWLPREPQNWDTADVFVDNRYISPDTWTDGTARRSSRRSTTSSAAPPSCTAPRCTGCGGRTSASCTTTTGSRRRWPISLRRDGAVLHPGRAALPGARRAGRGPDRAVGQRAATRSRRSRTSRASSSSPTTWPPPATTRSTPRAASCSTRRTWPTARACDAPPATASRAWCTPSPTPRCSACGRRWSTRTSRCSPTPRRSGWRPTRPARR